MAVTIKSTSALELLAGKLNELKGLIDSGSGGGGGARSYASFYKSGRGTTSLNNSKKFLQLDSVKRNSDPSNYTLEADTVTVVEAGDYRVSIDVYLNNSQSNRTEYSMWLELNGVEVSGTRWASYQRGYDSGMSSGLNDIIALPAGGSLKIACQRTDGSATAGYQDADGTRLTLERLT